MRKTSQSIFAFYAGSRWLNQYSLVMILLHGLTHATKSYSNGNNYSEAYPILMRLAQTMSWNPAYRLLHVLLLPYLIY